MSLSPGIDRRGTILRFHAPISDAYSALGTPRVGVATGLQDDPRFARLAVGLLAAAAEDEAAHQQTRSRAWLSVATSASGRAAEWVCYQNRLTAAASRQDLDVSQLRDLISAAPDAAPEFFSELTALLQEEDAYFFSASLLSLALRNIRQERGSAFTRALLEAAATFPATRVRAEELQNVLAGKAGFIAGLEFQAPRLLRDLSSPLNLASFGAAIWLSRAASLAVLSRSTRLGWGAAFLLSESAALGVEAPAMLLTRRLGMQLFEGDRELSSPASLGSELLAAYGSFAFLRLSGNAASFAVPVLRRLGGFTVAGVRLASDVAAVTAGNSLNAAFGLAPPAASASDALFQGLLTVGHMRLSGHMLEQLGWNGLGAALDLRRQALTLGRAHDLTAAAPFQPEMPLVSAGVSPRLLPRRFQFSDPHLVFMEGDESNPGSGDRPSKPPPTEGPSHKAVVFELVRQSLSTALGNYSREADTRDTVLGRAARRLHSLLQHLSRSSNHAEQDELFAKHLAEIKSELDAAWQHQSTLRNIIEGLRVLFQSTTSEDSVLPPEARSVVQEESSNIETDELHRSAVVTYLIRIGNALRWAREFGWSEDRYAQLVLARDGLNRLYNKGEVWHIPSWASLLRLNGHQEAMLSRREGAVLGLTVIPEDNLPDGSIARFLRSDVAQLSVSTDVPELDWLHGAILLAVQRPSWSSKELAAAVKARCESHRASVDSIAALHLTAEAVRHLVRVGPEDLGLLEHLAKQPHASQLQGRLALIRALSTPEGNLFPGLNQLGQGRSAGDLFSTGLHLFLHAKSRSAKGSRARLAVALRSARVLGAQGYHPSIALSLFGAAYGRAHLPLTFLPQEAQQEAILRRALSPKK